MARVLKEIISTGRAAGAVGPYNQAVKAGSTLYVSGQLGMDPATTTLVPGGVGPEMTQALKNMGAILEAAGSCFKDVVKCTVLLADMADFGTINDIYMQYFTENYPARLCYQAAALPKGGRVEIEAIAVLGCGGGVEGGKL